MNSALIRGFQNAAQIISVLSLISVVILIVVFFFGLATIDQLSPYMIAAVVATLIGDIMWWHFSRKFIFEQKLNAAEARCRDAFRQDVVELSREEFAATLARLVGAKNINEDAVPHSGHMMQLNTVAAFHFGMVFMSECQPTVGKLIDNLYEQYLHQIK